MSSVWMIRDKLTGEFIRATSHNGTTNIVQGANTHPSNGRMWKRRGDVTVHISANRLFYRSNVDRLEIVELALKESNITPMLDAIAIDTAKLLSK